MVNVAHQNVNASSDLTMPLRWWRAVICSLTETETETETNIISLSETERETEMICKTETKYKRTSEHMKHNSN